MWYKNIQPYAVDVGGRMIAAGEIADLNPEADAVAYLADNLSITPLRVQPPSQEPMGVDTSTIEES